MVSICSGGWGRTTAWAQEFKISLGNIVRPHIKKQYSVLHIAGLGKDKIKTEAWLPLNTHCFHGSIPGKRH
jgi:hypothetical protein